jgi:hypothetical protein
MLQDIPVHRLKGGKSSTGLPTGMLVTRPKELRTTFKKTGRKIFTDRLNFRKTKSPANGIDTAPADPVALGLFPGSPPPPRSTQ